MSYTDFGLVARGSTVMAFAITNVTLIDMVNSDPKPHSTVVVTGNRITAVGPTDGTDVPRGATIVDGTGQFLMPGLWDTHVHASRDLGIEYMPLLLATGVTGIRDMAGDFAVTQRFRAEIAAGTLDGPRIYAAGRRLNGSTDIDVESIVVRDAQSARQAVRAQKELGVDFIKVYSLLVGSRLRCSHRGCVDRCAFGLDRRLPRRSSR